MVVTPKIIETDNQQTIEMEFIDGKKLSEHLEQLDWKSICKKLAENLTKLHNQDLIHGDLTTSNMIFKAIGIQVETNFSAFLVLKTILGVAEVVQQSCRY